MLDHDFQPEWPAQEDSVCWAWIFSSDPVPIKMRCTKTWAEHKQAKVASLVGRAITLLELYYTEDSREVARELKAVFHTELLKVVPEQRESATEAS